MAAVSYRKKRPEKTSAWQKRLLKIVQFTPESIVHYTPDCVVQYSPEYSPSRKSGVSNVDMMIVKDKEVKFVCEIEESGFHPTKIFGKVFSTASAEVCQLRGKDIYTLDDHGVFVQIMSSDKVLEKLINPQNSKKIEQGDLIQIEIGNFLSNNPNSWIKQYRLLYGKVEDFKVGGKCYKELVNIINQL